MHKVMHNILKILTPCHILSHIQNLGPGPAPSRSEHQMASPSTNSCNSIEIRPVGGSITEKHHLQPSSLGASLCLEDCLCTDTEARDDSCMDARGKQPLLHLHLNMDIVHQQLDDDTTESYIYIYGSGMPDQSIYQHLPTVQSEILTRCQSCPNLTNFFP